MLGVKRDNALDVSLRTGECPGGKSEFVCLLLQYLLQTCSRGGREIVEDMYYERR
jgi:hypothetical protein